MFGIGQQGVAGLDLQPLGAFGVGQARVVVVTQHQAKTRQVHHKRVAQRLAHVVAPGMRQQAFGHPCCALLPGGVGHRQALREGPERLQRFGLGGEKRTLVPRSGQAVGQHAGQHLVLKCAFVRQLRQAVVADHQPTNSLRQRCVLQGLERGLGGAVQPVTVQPAGAAPQCFIASVWPHQPRQPGGVVVMAHKGFKQP